MRKMWWMWVVVVLSLAACGPSIPAGPTPTVDVASLPIIRLDSAHNQAADDAIDPRPAYSIPAGAGFVLELGDFEFKPAHDDVNNRDLTEPNFILIDFDATHSYSIAWQPNQTRYVVTARTVAPFNNAQPFPGFQREKEMILTIGYFDDNVSYSPWVVLIDFR